MPSPLTAHAILLPSGEICVWRIPRTCGSEWMISGMRWSFSTGAADWVAIWAKAGVTSRKAQKAASRRDFITEQSTAKTAVSGQRSATAISGQRWMAGEAGGWWSLPHREYKFSVEITACRDPKDNKFLSLAVSGHATDIITGDSDLLALNPFQGINILQPQNFLQSRT